MTLILEHKFDTFYKIWEEKTDIRKGIPKGSRMLVWDDKASFMESIDLIKYMQEKGIKQYYLGESHVPFDRVYPHVPAPSPNLSVTHDATHATEYAKKDTVVSIRLITDEEQLQEGHGLWVKMYKEKTFIPALNKNIVAYGVYEKDIVKTIWNGTTQYKGWDVTFQERMRLDSNGILHYNNSPIPSKPSIQWICQICGGDTSHVEYDYLGSGTNHLQCELNQDTPNRFALDN